MIEFAGVLDHRPQIDHPLQFSTYGFAWDIRHLRNRVGACPAKASALGFDQSVRVRDKDQTEDQKNLVNLDLGVAVGIVTGDALAYAWRQRDHDENLARKVRGRA